MAPRTAASPEEKSGLFIPMSVIISIVIIVAGSFIGQLILAAQRDKDIEELKEKVLQLATWREEHSKEHFQTAIQLNNTLNEIKNSIHIIEWQTNPKKPAK